MHEGEQSTEVSERLPNFRKRWIFSILGIDDAKFILMLLSFVSALVVLFLCIITLHGKKRRMCSTSGQAWIRVRIGFSAVLVLPWVSLWSSCPIFRPEQLYLRPVQLIPFPSLLLLFVPLPSAQTSFESFVSRLSDARVLVYCSATGGLPYSMAYFQWLSAFCQ